MNPLFADRIGANRAPIDPEEERRRRQEAQLRSMSRAFEPDAARVNPDASGGSDPLLSLLRLGAEVAPVSGEILSAIDAKKQFDEGNYGIAALSALGAVPMVGMVGRTARVGGKTVGKAAEAMADLAKVSSKAAKANKRVGAIPSIRDLTPAEALASAREGKHLLQVGTTGQYVGAPRGVTNPQSLGAMRRQLDQLVERGVEGGDWYKRAQAGITDAAGPSLRKQDEMSQGLSLFSSQANPDANLGFFLKALHGFESGRPESLVRTTRQADLYNTARATGTDIPLGPKTGIYEQKINPANAARAEELAKSSAQGGADASAFKTGLNRAHIPVNDIWAFRNFGFVDPKTGKPWSAGGTPQMHNFVDSETMLAADRANARQLGGRTDWDAASVQAAPWVYSKGVSLNKRFPKLYPTIEDGVREASKTYNDYFPKYTANATYEAIPGRGTGHLQGLLDAPEDVRRAFSLDPRSSWLEEGTGRDILYDALGTPNTRALDATGYYRAGADAALETNPARVGQPLVDLLSRKSGGPVIGPNSVEKLDAAELTRAYIDAQNAGAWHKTFPMGKGDELTSLRVPMNRALTPDEMRAMADTFEPRGFGLSDTGSGVTLMNFGRGPKTGRELTKAIKGSGATKKTAAIPGWAEDIEQLLPDAVGPVERARLQPGGYLDLQDALKAENAGQGLATRQLEETLTKNPVLLDKLDADPRIRQAALDRFERDAAFAGELGVARDDIQRARRLIGEGGFKALFEALRRGEVLPALAIGALGASAVGSQRQSPEGGA